MPRADNYRHFVAECLAIAQRADNPADRTRLLELANAFNELAVKSQSVESSESSGSSKPEAPSEFSAPEAP